MEATMANERTRFKCNGKPIFKTKCGTLLYTTKSGQTCEQSGMSPLVELYEKEDVFDETGWNIRYLRPGSVGHVAALQSEKLGASEVNETAGATSRPRP